MSASCIRRLQNMYKELQTDPIEGLFCEIPDESNMLEWNIYMEGPADSPYAGGVFKLIMTFPQTFPMEPPELKFASDFWHPNIYKDGRVCISILHPPVEDQMSGELAAERWLPTQTVGTVMLSVISMLSDPNISSPANLDASLEWRNERSKYIERCKRLVEKANREKPEHVRIPHPESDPVERNKRLQKHRLLNDDDDFMMESEDAFDVDADEDDDAYSDEFEFEESDASSGDSKKRKAPSQKDSKDSEKQKLKDKKDKGKEKSKEKTKDKTKDKAKEKPKEKLKDKSKDKAKEKSQKDKVSEKSSKSDKRKDKKDKAKDKEPKGKDSKEKGKSKSKD